MARRKQAGPAGALTTEAPPTKKVKSSRPKAAPTKATRSGSVPTSQPGVRGPRQAARPKATPSRGGNTTSVKASISRRLREIRKELFGERGGAELARRL